MQTDQSAIFTDLDFRHAKLNLGSSTELHFLFNYGSDCQQCLENTEPVWWFDYWSREPLVTEPKKEIQLKIDSGLISRVVIATKRPVY